MTNYFRQMGWREFAEGVHPDHLLDMARFLSNIGALENTVVWPRLPPPASDEVVENLPEVFIDSEDKDCTICLKMFKLNENALELPCHHRFHGSCIVTWLRQTNSCPICRHELPTDNEEYEYFSKEKKRLEEINQNLKYLHNSMYH